MNRGVMRDEEEIGECQLYWGYVSKTRILAFWFGGNQKKKSHFIVFPK